jgi:hypothetical protein
MGAAGSRRHSDRNRFPGSVGHGQQLSRQVVQVHLLAQPTAECLDGGGGGVAPVEAPIHGLLDTPAGRLDSAATPGSQPPRPGWTGAPRE